MNFENKLLETEHERQDVVHMHLFWRVSNRGIRIIFLFYYGRGLENS